MKIYEVRLKQEAIYECDGAWSEYLDAGFMKRKKAEKYIEQEKRKSNFPGWQEYSIKEKNLGRKRSKCDLNVYNIKPIEDICGLIRELYKTKKRENIRNISIAHATITGKAKPHFHWWTTEIYYILQGKGRLIIDEKSIELEKGNLFEIQEKKWHFLKGNLEVLVINHPAFDPKDVTTVE